MTMSYVSFGLLHLGVGICGGFTQS